MTTPTIQLSPSLFELVARRAARQRQSPDDFVEQLLVEQLKPRHPYVSIEKSRSGDRPMINGTRIGVDVIIGYQRAGHSAEEIANEILPDLTLAQVYDALGYYADNKVQMDNMLAEHSPDAWRVRLKRELGSDAAQLLFAE